MEIFGRYWELTLNLLATPFFVAVMSGLVLWGLRKIITTIISAKEERDKERHDALTTSLTNVHSTIDTLCQQNREEHQELYTRVTGCEKDISYIKGINNGTKILGGKDDR